jgi:hypothetical protein
MKRIIGVIILCAIIGVGAYFGTMYLDKLRKGGEVNVTVTFDDTETFKLESVKKMDKEKALKEWPYIMNVENTGSGKGLYQIIITDIETSTIPRDKLEYVLKLDDKEIASGNLKDVKDNILYTGEIEGNTKQEFKLYIWVIVDAFNYEEDNYEYKLEFNTIKSGGPGF